MRVKLTHGMQISEVPEKLKGLINEVILDLRQSIETLESAVGLCQTTYLPTVSVVLDDVRKTLGASDQSLEDIHAIASGLIEFYSKNNSMAKAEQTIDSELDAIKEKLADIGEELDAQE